jgi:hypothetical protein
VAYEPAGRRSSPLMPVDAYGWVGEWHIAAWATVARQEVARGDAGGRILIGLAVSRAAQKYATTGIANR